MIKRLIILGILLVSQIRFEEVGIVTMRTRYFSHLPYELSLQIPNDYKEIECYAMSGQPLEIHVTFPNSGYIYLSQQKYIPNTGKIKSLGNDVYNQRFSFLTGNPKYIYNPNGEELVLLNNEGIDSAGLYWRDIHYIFPDSICYVPRKGKLGQVNKDRRFRLSLGYSNVPYSDKETFDRIIESMQVVPTDNPPSPVEPWVQLDAPNPRIRHICEMPSVEEIQKQ